MANILQSAPVGNEGKAVIKSPRSEIVPFDHWHCGSDDFDRSISHQLAREKCPKRMFEADLCCIVHDACYMDEKRNRAICDEQFCHCLERTVARSNINIKGNNNTTKTEEIKENGCSEVSSTFCHIVNIFGGVAYSSSVDLIKKQKLAMEEWEKNEKEKKIIKEKELIEKKEKNIKKEETTIHKFPLKDCSDKRLVECSTQLQQCTNNLQNKNLKNGNIEASGNSFALLLSAQLAECTNQFCKCSSLKILKNAEKNDKECVNNLASICAQFSEDFGGILGKNEEKPNYLSLWSVNLNYQNDQSNNYGLTFIYLLLTLLLLTLLIFILFKITKTIKFRFFGKSKQKNYIQAKIRRNTLTNALKYVGGIEDDNYDDNNDLKRCGKNCGLNYISLNNQKKPSTVSSPTDSVANTSQQLLISCHKKTNSDVLPNKEKHLKTSTNLLLKTSFNSTINNSSSQTKLIEEINNNNNNNSTANSSSTLSDISSSN